MTGGIRDPGPPNMGRRQGTRVAAGGETRPVLSRVDFAKPGPCAARV